MWLFAVDVVSSDGVATLRLQGPTPQVVSQLALSVAARRGWSGASVIETVRLYRITRF